MLSDINAPLQLGPHMVPGLWRYMLPKALLELPLPAERRASCGNCPRIQTSGFRPDYRCCTYYPRVPNFLLGLALMENQTAAAAVNAVKSQAFYMPEGFQASPLQWADFMADVGDNLYGRSTRVLCPFLAKQSGLCGIYAFRNAVCSSFFCYHDHGKRGEGFWEALQTTVVQVEMALSQWALQQAGFDVRASIARMNALAPHITQTAHQLTRSWSALAHQAAWGEHYGQELIIYRRCAEAVLAHKEQLWDIANAQDIWEADAFETAAQSLVPAPYRDEIEDDYSDPQRETIRPRHLWQGAMQRLRNLHKIPAYPLVLSSRAFLDGAELSYRSRQGSQTFLWRQNLTPAEITALRFFERPREATPTLLAQLDTILCLPSDHPKHSTQGAAFVSEWHGRQILIKYP